MVSAGVLATLPVFDTYSQLFQSNLHIVSIVKIKDDQIGKAVEEALDLLGGISSVTTGKEKIMLKPNLVFDDPACTTNPLVIRSLVNLMRKAGKNVSIGEGSAVAYGLNADGKGVYFTRKADLLNQIQKQVFDKLGYTAMAEELHVPLINLHTGDLVDVEIPGAHHFKKITMHRSLVETDLLCSVPMMKTHALATVTLGLKNVIGLYPGQAYCSVRSCVHEEAEQNGSPGIAFEILDMAKANKMGLTVIDASTAMEGNGPSGGPLVKMNLIIAGTNPLATDMVAAEVMGIHPEEVPTFALAHTSGMKPAKIEEIEVRGEKIESVQRKFVRANVVPWNSIHDYFGAKEV